MIGLTGVLGSGGSCSVVHRRCSLRIHFIFFRHGLTRILARGRFAFGRVGGGARPPWVRVGMFVVFAAQGLVMLLSLRQSGLRDQHVWFVRGVAPDGDGM